MPAYRHRSVSVGEFNQLVFGVAVESILKARSQKMASKPNMAGEMAPIIPMTNPIHVMTFV
ncbi:hypothetical protein N9W43_07790 [Litoricolaceae bacterium]|nr:hypothetical protein [Litorivicinaceae bacterium]